LQIALANKRRGMRIRLRINSKTAERHENSDSSSTKNEHRFLGNSCKILQGQNNEPRPNLTCAEECIIIFYHQIEKIKSKFSPLIKRKNPPEKIIIIRKAV
jgi:hypothetical protein